MRCGARKRRAVRAKLTIAWRRTSSANFGAALQGFAGAGRKFRECGAPKSCRQVSAEESWSSRSTETKADSAGPCLADGAETRQLEALGLL